MSGVQVLKRPKTIWFAQILLGLTAGFLTAATVKSFAGNGAGSLSDPGIIFVFAVLAASVFGFVGLTRRSRSGKWPAIAALLGMAATMAFVIWRSANRQKDLWDDPTVGLLVLLFILMIFVAPLIVAVIGLVLNPRVELFFDPTAMIQVDKSAELFNDQPPSSSGSA